MADEIENNENSKEQEPVHDERLDKRKKKTDSKRQQALIRTALMFGILIIINIISVNLFYRIDLTGNKIYTLSSASKQLVGNLDDKMVVKAYFTDNLPAPYNNTRRYLKETLDDYRNYSKGNFQYEIISPSDETELEKDAQKYGIQPVQVQTYNNDKAESMKAYMGMVFLYNGKQESLPFLGNIPNLEYEITGVVKRLTEKQLKKVGILSGPGMPGQDKIGKVAQFLTKYYQIVPVDASKNAPIPADISVLIAFSPKEPQQQQQMGMKSQTPPPVIPEYLKFAIDQYIMGGGRFIFLASKINVSSQQQFQFGQVTNCGIEDMFESYGIKYLNNIVTDKECAYVNVPVQQGPMQFYTQMPFPYYPKIININKDIPAFSGIGQVFLGLTSSLDTSIAGSKGMKVEPLLTTSPKTGTYQDIAVIQTSGKMLPDTMFKTSNLPVGILYTGKYNSFYKGKTIPSDTAAGSAPAPTSIKDVSPETKVIALGNGDFVQDEFKGPDENLAFFASMIDYMADDAGLSEIRQKDATPKPLKPIEDSTKKLVKYSLLAGPPLLVLLFGVYRWRKRKKLNQ
jgi:gliding-associated putative ABC transporter substrate-binding component GldG